MMNKIRESYSRCLTPFSSFQTHLNLYSNNRIMSSQEDVKMGQEEGQKQPAVAAKSVDQLSRKAKRQRMSSKSPPNTTSSRTTTPTPEAASAAAISAAAAAAAAQAASAGGLTGLYSLLTTIHGMPSVEQVQQAANKAVNDVPPYVHLSTRDAAPQLKLDHEQMKLVGGMRGYRMARASHGVSEGTFYFEVIVLPPPTAQEISASLPPNVRLGPKLQKQLEQVLKSSQESSNPQVPRHVGGNLRIGWSMRTGDLQAPVGYDKWSYGLGDVAGSRIHASKREDHWGGEPFGPGDVVGFLISLQPEGTRDIRFFKNGNALGEFVVRKGKREGGTAFEDITEGTYYPAISSYMGGTCKVNFGPHFCYAPRGIGKLKVTPMSDVCPAPPSPEEAVANATKERIFRKTDDSIVAAFREAIETEAKIRRQAYQAHLERHVKDVRALREERKLSTSDLPPPPDVVMEKE